MPLGWGQSEMFQIVGPLEVWAETPLWGCATALQGVQMASSLYPSGEDQILQPHDSTTRLAVLNQHICHQTLFDHKCNIVGCQVNANWEALVQRHGMTVAKAHKSVQRWEMSAQNRRWQQGVKT